jgi:glycerol-3-phosphate cytidylyltransferase
MIVYTGGTFDLFHSGHARLLERCRKLAGVGKVVVSLNTDEFVATYKEPPICSLEERMETVAACRWVDKVIVNTGGPDSKPAILSVNPDFVVVGSDWENKDYHKQMGFTQGWLDEHRISVRFVPYTENVSSSIIKARLLDRVWQ